MKTLPTIDASIPINWENYLKLLLTQFRDQEVDYDKIKEELYEYIPLIENLIYTSQTQYKLIQGKLEVCSTSVKPDFYYTGYINKEGYPHGKGILESIDKTFFGDFIEGIINGNFVIIDKNTNNYQKCNMIGDLIIQ